LDVVRVRHEGGRTLMYCLDDKTERLLVDGLQKAHGANKELEKKLKQNVQLTFCLPDILMKGVEHPVDMVFAEPMVHYSYAGAEAHSPPPKGV